MSGRRARPSRLLLAWVLTVLLAATAAASATSALDRALATLLERAEVRIYGDVVASEATLDDDGEIRTTVRIGVVRDLDGSDIEADATRAFRFLGGELADGRVAVVDDVPRLEEGERVLLLGYRDEGLASPVVGVWQGLWRVGPDGLSDDRGRVLGLDDGALRIGGGDRDVDAVLDALASGAEVAEASSDAAPFEATEPVDAEPSAPPGSPEAPADGEVTQESAAPMAAPVTGQDSASAGAPPAAAIRLELDVPDDEALRAALQEAAAAWRDVGAPLQVAFDDDAVDRIRVGPAALFGADALALSRRLPGAGGVEILLRPGGDGRRLDVLARELGLLAGLPDGGPGLRSARLPVRDARPPDAGDARALLAARSGAPEDLDGDGSVDLYDLALLAEAYGRVGTRLPADLDGSGRVDDADVELLRAAYEFLPAARDAPPGRRSTRD